MRPGPERRTLAFLIVEECAMSAPALCPLAFGTRLACAGGSFVLTGVIVGALLGLFGHAGPSQWLTPSSELLALLAPCQRLAGRGERLKCQREAIAALRDGTQRQVAVAP
jgi:hypothetical protein